MRAGQADTPGATGGRVHPAVHWRAPAPGCDGTLRKVDEDVTEILKYIPGHFEVDRHVRPAMSCRKCESMVQAPMPALPIPRGEADTSLLAHVAVAKYCDHLPLYRQSEIYAREGIDFDRSLLADWTGKMAWLLAPLAEKIEEHVMAGSVIHADDTPVKVLAPGRGQTKIGRFWVYLRDERPHLGSAPPAVVYRYTPDRKGEHCRAHLASFNGHLHADGYALFGQLYHRGDDKPGAVIEKLEPRAQAVLRRAQVDRVAYRQRGAREDRRALRHRAPDRRAGAEPAPKGSC